MKRLYCFRENLLTPGTYAAIDYHLSTVNEYARRRYRYIVYVDGEFPQDPDILRIWQRYVSGSDEQVQHE